MADGSGRVLSRDVNEECMLVMLSSPTSEVVGLVEEKTESFKLSATSSSEPGMGCLRAWLYLRRDSC